jgi:hypothetical protein
MSQSSLLQSLVAFVKSMFYALRRKNIDYRSQDLGGYIQRESGQKPPRFQSGEFVLFYRSRLVWNIIQAVAAVLITWWTLRNYALLFKSL